VWYNIKYMNNHSSPENQRPGYPHWDEVDGEVVVPSDIAVDGTLPPEPKPTLDELAEVEDVTTTNTNDTADTHTMMSNEEYQRLLDEPEDPWASLGGGIPTSRERRSAPPKRYAKKVDNQKAALVGLRRTLEENRPNQ
jgi:hypothetical protein